MVNEEGIETGKEELHFFYDAQSKPVFVEYGGVKYRYIYNVQGDIVAIVDTAGNIVVEYKYDAWGKPICNDVGVQSALANLNIFYYRGYVWDAESDLYYLRSRFYKPEWMRFINADIGLVQSVFVSFNNLFSYTENDPVNNIDSDGYGVNPFPFHSIPYDYQYWRFDDGTVYERWYNSYGWPQVDRHWTDHGKPQEHTNPHDHYWNPNDPAQKPSHTDRNRVNTPSPRWPGQDKWEDEKKKHESDKKDNSNTAKSIVAGAIIVYGIYQGVKWLIAWGAAVPTSGLSLGLLATP